MQVVPADSMRMRSTNTDATSAEGALQGQRRWTHKSRARIEALTHGVIED